MVNATAPGLHYASSFATKSNLPTEPKTAEFDTNAMDLPCRQFASTVAVTDSDYCCN